MSELRLRVEDLQQILTAGDDLETMSSKEVLK